MIVRRLARELFHTPLAHRNLSTSLALLSGHNRWSKIKHDKGKVDEVKTRQRQSLAQELTQASRASGADPALNNRLAALIATAKKSSFPKASIDAAIARGQGKSTSGNTLENVTVEVMLPHAIAAIIECLTDSKARLLQDLREVFKSYGANMTSTSYLFEKKGKLLLKSLKDLGEEELLEQAIGAGALDVDTREEGSIVVLTEPGDVTAVGCALETALGIEVESTGFIWAPKEDAKVEIPSEYTERLTKFI
ncbi:hypothetical protein MMC13_001648, partial [Lambiella insularis]|nr:hypothetical protein [Lambiella insularis]